MGSSTFSIQQLMIKTGVIGCFLMLLVRYPRPVIITMACVGVPLALVSLIFGGIKLIPTIPLRIRLAIVFAILLTFVALWAVSRTPGFYVTEQERCERLGRLARRATGANRETRIALDREAAWLSRKAAELRRRGLWLGLTLGPDWQYQVGFSKEADVYHFGVLESIDRHEIALHQLISPGSPQP